MNWFRVAPLDDDDLLAAIQSSMRAVILPELERLGADDFVLSQVRSTLSMVGFVRRGLGERLVAHAQMQERLAQILSPGPEAAGAGASPVVDDRRSAPDPEVAALLRRRLAVEIATRTAPNAR